MNDDRFNMDAPNEGGGDGTNDINQRNTDEYKPEEREQQRSYTSENTEYSYTRDTLPRQTYMDAAYQTKQEAGNEPRSYYTPPKKLDKPKKKKKGNHIMLKAACLGLVCALLGSVAGGAIVASVMNKNDSGYRGSSINVVRPTETDVSTAPVVSGEELTGAQIYQLGCNQTVGITTDVTYTNFFGIQTSAPVSGSGFIASSDGYIVTNYHVVRDAFVSGYDISVMLFNGEKYPAKIVGTEEDSDIAVLKIDESGLSAVTFGSSDALLVGESVYAIGNPLGELNFSMSSGSVSALDREITTKDEYTGKAITNTMFQIDAAVNSGNSGGPVYNSRGEVVGIVTAKYADTGVEGLGFAIPIDKAINMIDQIITKGYVSGKPYFGITVRPVEKTVAEYYDMAEGLYVASVEEGSCSDKAGLVKGDIITGLGGVSVKTTNELNEAKNEYKAGDTVEIEVFRSGETIKMKITFDEAPPPENMREKEEAANEGENGRLPKVPKK